MPHLYNFFPEAQSATAIKKYTPQQHIDKPWLYESKSLPRELRDRVYHYLIEEKTIKFELPRPQEDGNNSDEESLGYRVAKISLVVPNTKFLTLSRQFAAEYTELVIATIAKSTLVVTIHGEWPANAHVPYSSLDGAASYFSSIRDLRIEGLLHLEGRLSPAVDYVLEIGGFDSVKGLQVWSWGCYRSYLEELEVWENNLETINDAIVFGKTAVYTGGKRIERFERVVSRSRIGMDRRKGVQVAELVKKVTQWKCDEVEGWPTVVEETVHEMHREIDWSMPL